MSVSFNMLLDGKKGVLSGLYELLSIFGTCKIDDTYLTEKLCLPYYVSVGIVYENRDFRLIITSIEQPKSSRDLKSMIYNTSLVVRYLNWIVLLTVSADPIYFFLRLLFSLCLFGILFLIQIVLMIIELVGAKSLPKSWPGLIFILQTEEEKVLLLAQIIPRNRFQLLLPSLKMMGELWVIAFDSPLEFDFFFKSNFFQATGHDMKLSLKTTSSLSNFISAVIATLGQIFDTTDKTLIKVEDLKKNKTDSLYIKPTYSYTVVGKTFDIELRETTLSISTYLKLKVLIEKYEQQRKFDIPEYGEIESDMNASVFVAIELSDVQLCNHKEEKPFGVATSVSLVYSNSISNIKSCNPMKNTACNGKLLDPLYASNDIRIECKLTQLDFFLNSSITGNDDDNERIILSDATMLYSCTAEDRNVYEANISGKSNGCRELLDFRCKKVEVDMSEICLNSTLEEPTKRALKCICFVTNFLRYNSSPSLLFSCKITEFSVQVVQIGLGAANLLYDDDIINHNIDLNTTKQDSCFAFTFVIYDAHGNVNGEKAFLTGRQIDHYFGELSYKNIYEMTSLTNTMTMVEHKSLWFPE